MKCWEYNPNDHQLAELPSMLPGLHQEKNMRFIDHCWLPNGVLCTATIDCHVHLFEDGEFKKDFDVGAVISEADASGANAAQKEQAKAMMMFGSRKVVEEKIQFCTLISWSRGFVVGGD